MVSKPTTHKGITPMAHLSTKDFTPITKEFYLQTAKWNLLTPNKVLSNKAPKNHQPSENGPVFFPRSSLGLPVNVKATFIRKQIIFRSSEGLKKIMYPKNKKPLKSGGF